MSSAPSCETGFVLPSVLAYIAAFTLVILIAAGSLERSSEIAARLDRSASLSAALDTGEARAVFAFLTTPPVPGGVDLAGRAASAGDILAGTAESDAAPYDVWAAAGGLRLLSDGRVRVWAIYQDASGLISLNTSTSEVITGLLEGFGVRQEDARSMTAALADYQDGDSVRRPLGAERADYRLRGMAPPSNSPLRTPVELSQVLGWQDFGAASSLEFLNFVTPSPHQGEPRTQFASPEVRALLHALPPRLTDSGDPLTDALQASLLPTDRARFILVARDDATPFYRVRIVEIQRQPTASARPYSRLLLFENTVSQLPENWLPSENVQTLDPSEPSDR